MFRFFLTILLVQIVNFSAIECLASDMNVTAGVEKKLIVGDKVYNFIEKAYIGNNLPEIPVEKGKLNLKTPENALINILSSMYVGDYDWRKQLVFDVENIESYEKFLKFKSQANTFFKNRNIYIDKKFEFKQLNNYVVIKISVGKIPIPYTFRNIDGDWKLCLQCSTDENNDLFFFLLNHNFDFEGKEKIIKMPSYYTKTTN